MENFGVFLIGDLQIVHIQLARVGKLAAEQLPYFFQPGEGGGIQIPEETGVGVGSVVEPVQDLLLALEMVVDCPLAHAEAVDDVLNGGVVVALLLKKTEGYFQYFAFGLFGEFVSGHETSLLSYIPAVCK